MGGAAPGVGLGEDHVVGADAREDLAVRGGDGLGPDPVDPQVHEVRGGQHRGLDGRAHTHHGGGELGGAELAQGVDVRGVGLDHVGELAGHLLHEGGVAFHAEDLAPLLDQLQGRSGAEATEPHHQDGDGVGGVLSQ